MHILFKTKQLEKIFATEKALVKKFGTAIARIIIMRRTLLEAAPTLKYVPIEKPTRRHQLENNRHEQFSVDLKHRHRLIFQVANDPIPRKEDGGIELDLVTAIIIIEVIDYH